MKNGPVIVIILILLTLSLESCSSSSKDESNGKSAREVMKDYTDTLSKAPSKAKSALELEGKRNEAQDEAMKELDKQP